jgi:aldehyde:ferredoxin oxidoreductase
MNRYAWAGHILKVNLSQGFTQIEESEPYLREFIGGRGFGQSISLTKHFSFG